MSKLPVKSLVALAVVGAFLGASFLFFQSRPYYVEMSLELERSDLPYTNVVIEGIHYPLVIDLGSRLEMSLKSSILKQLHRSQHGTEKWKNFQGKEFEYPTYTLPKVAIGSLALKQPVVVEIPEGHRQEYSLSQDSVQNGKSYNAVGYLGRGLLKKANLLFDVKRSKIIFTNDLKKMQQNGYDIEAFTSVPFYLDPRGIILDVETDLLKARLLLDSGATLTILHKNLYPSNVKEEKHSHGLPMVTSSIFRIKGEDFGKQDLYFLDMGHEALADVDGLLGMDFIKKHVLYIDFSQRVLYIQNP